MSHEKKYSEAIQRTKYNNKENRQTNKYKNKYVFKIGPVTVKYKTAKKLYNQLLSWHKKRSVQDIKQKEHKANKQKIVIKISIV